MYHSTRGLFLLVKWRFFVIARCFSFLMPFKGNCRTSCNSETFPSDWSNLIFFWRIVECPCSFVNKPQKSRKKIVPEKVLNDSKKQISIWTEPYYFHADSNRINILKHINRVGEVYQLVKAQHDPPLQKKKKATVVVA